MGREVDTNSIVSHKSKSFATILLFVMLKKTPRGVSRCLFAWLLLPQCCVGEAGGVAGSSLYGEELHGEDEC